MSVGSVLKSAAGILAILAVIGVMVLLADEYSMIPGTWIVGLLVAAGLQCLLLYAFGEVVDLLAAIKNNTAGEKTSVQQASADLPEL